MGMLNVMGRRAGQLVSFIWRILPWMLRVIWDIAKTSYDCFVSTFRGWPITARKKATEWRRKVMERRIITQDYDQEIWWIFYILAYVTLVFGWLAPPFLTVWLVVRVLY